MVGSLSEVLLHAYYFHCMTKPCVAFGHVLGIKTAKITANAVIRRPAAERKKVGKGSY